MLNWVFLINALAHQLICHFDSLTLTVNTNQREIDRITAVTYILRNTISCSGISTAQSLKHTAYINSNNDKRKIAEAAAMQQSRSIIISRQVTTELKHQKTFLTQLI